MSLHKRQEEHMLFATLLSDVQKSHASVFSTRALRLTLQKVDHRIRMEGLSFLSKTLPRLGKCLDKALAEQHLLTTVEHRWKPMFGSELPMFMGEFFSRVFDKTGKVLPFPCADSIRVLRLVLYIWYKYELPYTPDQEQQVINKFIQTERDLVPLTAKLEALKLQVGQCHHYDTEGVPLGFAQRYGHHEGARDQLTVVRGARILLHEVFSGFDFRDIVPRHGPGAVATKQQAWDKFSWTNICGRLVQIWPLDQYFYAGPSHVYERLSQVQTVTDKDLPARVVLVPKDSRGPRLISCEPVDFQWIQQGIMKRLVKHTESLDLTRFNVFFTDQGPNRRGAQLGSATGRYVTLDLNEASDRVSLALVRLLFPEHSLEFLEAARSQSTELPSGEILKLQKFAPMGSALCFPILALTVWSILTAAAPDAVTRERILVYGDDVIVPEAFALNAIEQLESFGLKVNRDKSCTKGFFRESCGMDAFKGVDVTPVRFRTVWSSSRSPDVYASWIAYANSMWSRQCFNTYDLIVKMLTDVYGDIPDASMQLACPHLIETPENAKPRKTRINQALQKRQWKVWDLKAPSVIHESDGWEMLLRFFTESNDKSPHGHQRRSVVNPSIILGGNELPFSVSSYTPRRTSMLVRRWR